MLSYISTDVDLMIAGILLEAYDDSLESKKKLQNDFGDTVANLVLGYQKLRNVDWNEDIYNENDLIIAGKTTLETTPATLLLPSFVFVCPSN